MRRKGQTTSHLRVLEPRITRRPQARHILHTMAASPWVVTPTYHHMSGLAISLHMLSTRSSHDTRTMIWLTGSEQARLSRAMDPTPTSTLRLHLPKASLVDLQAIVTRPRWRREALDPTPTHTNMHSLRTRSRTPQSRRQDMSPFLTLSRRNVRKSS